MSRELAARVREIIDDNVFMALGTAGEDGTPWVSPVFFASADHVDFYWISGPDTTHSRNLAVRPEVSIVIFNSQLRPGSGQARAVYLAGTAGLVPEAEVAHGLEIYPGAAERGGRVIAPEELRPPGPYRLYRATATRHWVLCPRPDGQPCEPHGIAYDHRTPVTL